MKKKILEKIYITILGTLLIVIGAFSEKMRHEDELYAAVKAQKTKDLEKCKEAGWEFIDDVFSFARISKTDQRLTPQALEELRYLQSKAATKCIVRFEL